MSDKHPIRTGIIGTVVGGLILAAVLAVIGKIPLMFTVAKAVLAFVFGVLGTVFGWLGTVLASADSYTKCNKVPQKKR